MTAFSANIYFFKSKFEFFLKADKRKGLHYTRRCSGRNFSLFFFSNVLQGLRDVKVKCFME